MSKHSEEVRQKQLLKQQDWDRHNKKADRAAQAYQDYMATDGIQKPKKKSGKRWLIALAILVALAAIGGGVYEFVLSGKGKSEQATSQTSDTPAAAPESAASTATKDFSSTNFGLSFKYPDNWVVDESNVDKLTVTSPKTSLTTASGTKTSGKIIMSIRAKGQELSEFAKGNATATRVSELLKYKTPTQNQRANTYLTFAAFAGSISGIDGMYITGDYGYQKDQGVLKTDVAAIDPVINVTFNQCSDTTCSKTIPISVSSSSWDDKNFADPIRNMLQSVTIQ